jgi:CRISPR-associated endonuclease Cas1
MEINEFHHPDSVWTWRPSRRRAKVSLWLPYFQGVERLPKGKGDRYRFTYNGGEVTCHLKELDFLMFYGASGDLSLEFLDKLNTYKIPVMIHRRNVDRPYVFFPERGNDEADILTAQILARENQIRRCFVARTLVRERIRRFSPLCESGTGLDRKLAAARDIAAIRNIEATASKKYWRRWYEDIGFPAVSRREEKHPVNEALDAGSFFFYGILLRWILFHKLSPNHGFLHEPTDYPSLAYDLMEPYRHLIEDAVHEAVVERGGGDRLTPLTLSLVKERLDRRVYVPATRQEVRQKNLLHGMVLALRSYLLGDSRRLVVPAAGKKTGGRPLKIGYRLPGG